MLITTTVIPSVWVIQIQASGEGARVSSLVTKYPLTLSLTLGIATFMLSACCSRMSPIAETPALRK